MIQLLSEECKQDPEYMADYEREPCTEAVQVNIVNKLMRRKGSSDYYRDTL